MAGYPRVVDVVLFVIHMSKELMEFFYGKAVDDYNCLLRSWVR